MCIRDRFGRQHRGDATGAFEHFCVQSNQRLAARGREGDIDGVGATQPPHGGNGILRSLPMSRNIRRQPIQFLNKCVGFLFPILICRRRRGASADFRPNWTAMGATTRRLAPGSLCDLGYRTAAVEVL